MKATPRPPWPSWKPSKRFDAAALSSLETVSDLVERVRELLPSVRRDLEALVRIESVGADPARRAQVTFVSFVNFCSNFLCFLLSE
jgi:predicted component of type VI protein secretion system